MRLGVVVVERYTSKVERLPGKVERHTARVERAPAIVERHTAKVERQTLICHLSLNFLDFFSTFR
ncbi:hypothetical protein CIL05_01280 [Virgibacillus profundi]|uniref:Uncharacterized protein n=1 Tax=Virgibacillus profundi TaxID=2024555 RepID=A0A2A2IJM6_9BACI|nr:hypothetical protein CIL05_01280 [Virgibacillus profundi]PXY55498.1 hypothetical protein CIT14_01285 [Virgibacillus profundi]